MFKRINTALCRGLLTSEGVVPPVADKQRSPQHLSRPASDSQDWTTAAAWHPGPAATSVYFGRIRAAPGHSDARYNSSG
jgi:hypothetical protein